jgi:RNA polymerase sigma-32 factor
LAPEVPQALDNDFDKDIFDDPDGEIEIEIGPGGYPVPVPDPRDITPVPYSPAEPPAGRGKDSLQSYLAEVRRFKLLDKDEEAELLRRYSRDGDFAAGQTLITANLRLVVKIAMEFQSHWLNNLQDLIQEGNMGLLQALKKFDPSRGAKFSYYASYWIKAYIFKFIMDNWRLVKIGTTQAQRKLFFNLKKEREKLMREGLDPGPQLLAERLGVSQGDVEEMSVRLDAGREVSLDSPFGSEMEESQISFLPSEEDGADNILASHEVRTLVADKVLKFRKTLDTREIAILDRRLMNDEPVTLQEIGEEFGVSRERVRQIEERLKKKLSAYLLQELPDLSLDE